MDFGDILDLIELILSLAILGVLVWSATAAYGWKGFLTTIGGIAALVFLIDGFENLLDYILDNHPALFIAFLAVLALLMVWIFILGVYEQYKKMDKIEKDEYMKRLLKDTLIIVGIVAAVSLLLWFIFWCLLQ